MSYSTDSSFISLIFGSFSIVLVINCNASFTKFGSRLNKSIPINEISASIVYISNVLEVYFSISPFKSLF